MRNLGDLGFCIDFFDILVVMDVVRMCIVI